MGSLPQFTVRIDSRNRVARVALAGELDMATTPVLEGHLAEVENDGVTAIMLDLRDLTFLDSSGLHAFLNARSRAMLNGHHLIFVGAGSQSRRLFELTRTEFLMDDRGAAGVIERFNGTQPSRATQTEGGRARDG